MVMKDRPFLDLRLEDFDRLRDRWDKLLTASVTDVPFLTWEWQSSWWETFGHHCRLLLLGFYSAEELIGVAPLMVKDRVVQFIGSELSDYLDILVLPGWEEEVCERLMDFLAEAGDWWEEIQLHCFPSDTPVAPVLVKAAKKRGLKARMHQEEVCPSLPLPANWEDLLKLLSKKQRHEIRRKLRRLSGEGEVKLELVRDTADFKSALARFVTLHQSSKGPVSLFEDARNLVFFREMGRAFFVRGWLDLGFLVLNGQRVASFFSLCYNHRIYYYQSGYDPQFASLSVGVGALAYYLKFAIESGVKEFDFLRGSEAYKYRWGAKDSPILLVEIGK